MSERRPQDADIRAVALDPARSFIVQAPAGSGKTELLTQRFLRLLAVVERPEEIVAITFTRKAAGEMRSRIQDTLRLGLHAEPPPEPYRAAAWQLARAALARDAARGWGLLDNPRRLRIETIDALNAWLARQLPLSSRLGAAPVIADDPGPVYLQTAREVLRACIGSEPHAEHAEALLRHFGGRFGLLEELLAGMLAARDHWLGKVVGERQVPAGALRARLEQALRHLVEDELGRARAALPAGALDEIVRLGRDAARRLPATAELAPLAGLSGFPPASADALPAWQAIAHLLLTRSGNWRAKVDRNLGFPPDAREAKQEITALLEWLAERTDPAALQRVRRLPAPAYGEARWVILAHLLALLPVAAAALNLAFAARGESDYVGIARAALDALGPPDAPTDLALALDCRISHLLVDEFQDTSQAQVELLERLTAGWVPSDGRSLFCVGDPMQSIYRFREADVGRFLRAQATGIGDLPLETLRLEVNFRSQAGLVEWVSGAFPAIFPQRADLSLGAVPFAPSVPWHACLPGEALQCIAAPAGDARAEAAAVADLVRRLRRDEPEASIAVLVRSRTHLAEITVALKAAGTPFSAVEIERLAESPAIRDLEALTRAICHRADRTAWLALLRAPWCGLSLADLLKAAGEKRDDIWERLNSTAVIGNLSPPGQSRVTRLVEALAPALAARGRRPLRRVVESAWLALGAPATLERPSQLADARAFLEFLDARARQADLDDPPALSGLLGELYAAPDSMAPDAVQLLTMHKAKGLEFDHVILPGLDRSAGRREKQLLRWLDQVRESGTELILAPVERLGEAPDDLHRALRDLDARRDLLELDRLLYVAVTRARRRLHLVARLGQDDPASGAAPGPRSGTLLERLWPALGARFLAARQSGPAQGPVGATRSGPRLRRLVADWRWPALPPAVHFETVGPAAPEPGEAVEYDWSGREARAIGVAVHRLLQVIAVDGAEAWPAGRLETARPLVATWLREAGLGPAEHAAALPRCIAALAQTLADPRGRWLLDPAHAGAASELRLSGRLDGRLVDGVVDRSFVDAAGTLWIVDFKAGRHEGGELEVFLDREQARYKPQLERYARLMAPRHAGPVRLGLYFPQHAGWREWPAPEC